MPEKKMEGRPRWREFAWTALLALVAVGWPPMKGFAQEPEQPAAKEKWTLAEAAAALHDLRRGVAKFTYAEDGTLEVHLSGGVDWTYTYDGEPVRLRADRVLVTLRERSASAQDGTTRLGEGDDFTFYSEGNVRLEVPARRTFFEADSLLYESLSRYGVAYGARVRTTVTQARSFNRTLGERQQISMGENPTFQQSEDYTLAPLHLTADVLRFFDFQFFEGERVRVSNCDYGVPHFAVSAESVEVYPVGESPDRLSKGEESGDDEKTTSRKPAGDAFIIDPEDSWIRVQDQPAAPLPIARWDTRWNDFFPIRSAEFGSSSQFGTIAGVDWNVNYFLKQMPLDRLGPLRVLEDEVRLGFETTYLEERGLGWGPNAEYGTKARRWDPWQLELNNWTHYGQAQYFAIDDRADEDRFTRLPVPREDRYWGHVWHRQAVPYLGTFDLEYSDLSDRAFLEEYFEDVAKEEKEQENIIYWRRNFRDNIALTGLYEYRVDDFVSENERLPEGKFFLLQQPVWSTGLYTDLQLQAVQLRQRPDDDLGLPTRDYDRYDAVSEFAYPFSLGRYLQLRPFSFSRFTYYGEVDDPTAGSEERAAFGAGITVSQQWSRVFRLRPGSLSSRVFNAPLLKHVFVPRVTYANTFSNDLESEETIAVDAVDVVDKREAIILSLTNEVLTRRPIQGESTQVKRLLGGDRTLETTQYMTERLLESEVSFAVFPHEERDNEGDPLSLLTLDNTVLLFRGLTARGYVQLDPNDDLHGELVSASLNYEVVPERLSITVGDRFSRNQSNVAFLWGRVNLTDKWFFDGYYSRDFEDQRDVEYRFSLSRRFHRFVASVSYEEDVGEDRNRTVLFNFAPFEVFQSRRQRLRGW